MRLFLMVACAYQSVPEQENLSEFHTPLTHPLHAAFTMILRPAHGLSHAGDVC